MCLKAIWKSQKQQLFVTFTKNNIMKVQKILNDWIKSMFTLSQNGKQRLKKKKLLTQFLLTRQLVLWALF